MSSMVRNSRKGVTSRVLSVSVQLAVLLVLLVQFGCSTAPPAKRPDVYFPGPPAEPKLKWATTFVTQHDFPKTSKQLFQEKFLGKMPGYRFYKPFGVASDGEGNLYVADMDVHNIKIVDFNNSKIHTFKDQPWGKQLTDLHIDSKGRLYAVDSGSHAVFVFDAKSRKDLFAFGGKDLFTKPTYLAINEELGRIYVTDAVGHKVVVFDLEGKHLFTFGQQGAGLGDLYGPTGIAIAPNGNVYVAEFFNTRIHVFDQDGKPIKFFGERGDSEVQFEGPRGLAFTSDGLLVVAEARKAALAIYDQDGNPLTFMGGKRSTHILGFTLPTGVFVDKDDTIYISDTMNKSVTVWQYLSQKYLQNHKIEDEVPLGRSDVVR